MKKLLLSAFALISIGASAQIYPLVDGFESYPDAVELGTQGNYNSDMTVYSLHGTESGKAVVAWMNNSNTEDSLVTPLVGPLTPQSVLTFQYRAIESVSYPNNAAIWGANDKIEVWGRPDMSSNFLLMATIDSANYIIGNDFKTVTLSLEAGAGVSAYFMLKVTRGNSGDYFVDFDSLTVKDLITGLIIKPTTSNPVCNGANDGSISLLIEGGVAPYTYTWTPALPNTGNQSNLNAGTYSVTVSDNSGRSATRTMVLTQPEAVSLSTVATDVSCHGGNNGAVNLTVENGVAPYTFLWSNNILTEDVTNLPAGTYYVAVADAFNCTATTSQVVDEPEVISVTETHTTSSGPDANDASITVTAAGGVSNFQYSLNGGAYFASGVFNNLAEGCYTVRVKDGNECEYVSAPVCVTETVSAIREFGSDQVLVYPIPASTHLVVRTSVSRSGEITIVSATGSTVFRKSVNASETRIDVTGIATGKYILTFKTNNGTFRKHIAIVH